ncbi:SAM-dependent methyltransferase [Veronia nyctiphanis]|uniref:SAM-dependent methyltransferase n=1 Tax=Veronia nyctiphanis TaxID=1278244 RepID=A0A4Q0YTL6_9GAMM|nr:class I SAM-dependent methyltransferase [Veronia nyctiphanis]RXJ74063.1 SAM-dependent methyltransferase [Veronia nyctiphanis]
MLDNIKTDNEFSQQRLAELYDFVDGSRDDLDPYIYLSKAFDAKSILDIGCGTGSLLCKLAKDKKLNLYGVDPALASLNVAKKKPLSRYVTWIHGDTSNTKTLSVDLALMTGNVAQVFLTNDAWLSTLRDIHDVLNPGGRLVFETRRPQSRAWEAWNKEDSYSQQHIPGVGIVEKWVELTDVSLPFVSFRWFYHFRSDDSIHVSDSTIIFRDKEDIESTLLESGFNIIDILQAPDRPGKEFVFIAEKSRIE